MKLVAIAVIVYYVLIHYHYSDAMERPNMRPPYFLAEADTSEDQPTTAAETQEVGPKADTLFVNLFRFDKIETSEEKELMESKLSKEEQSIRMIYFQNYCTIIFILIMVILAGVDIILLQLMFKRNIKTINLAIVSVTTFIVAVNVFSFLFILRATAATDHALAQH